MSASPSTCSSRYLPLILVCVALASAPVTAAAAPGDRAQALLDELRGPAASARRLEAASELAALGPGIVSDLATFLGRTRGSSEAERRAVLMAIDADIPDEKGRFRSSTQGKSVDLDWLAALAALDPATPGLGDVIADVAAIRALAASASSAGADALLDFGFSEAGTLYRDECGRSLRAMTPYSLPTLITASQNNAAKQRAQQRYANYQLDRMDRQDPNKAINDAAADPRLMIEVIRAYGQSKHREAIGTLLERIDDEVAMVRDAARDAILGYVTGPKPPEAPKRKLVLPGGKLSDEEKPLWLTYRELADIELRRKHEDVFGEGAPRRSTPEDVARKLFAHYDDLRAQADAKAYEQAAALAQAGSFAEATTAFDRLLALQPEHPSRKDMARAYFERARELAQAGSYRDAAAAYSKAHGLGPEAPFAEDALAAHYTALGKALEAEGKDGSAAYRRALAIEPTQRETRAAHMSGGEGKRPTWMLYAGLGGGAGAFVLLILGLAVRRR